MTGNRVEELERTVAELEATVSGLTDELVETKERLRLIEDHFGPELDDIIAGTANRAPERPADDPPTEAGETPAADGGETATAADGTKPEEQEADDDTAGSDDIIVA
ncbi:hypothetical protein [Halosegnis sp.]|uniref:DUF7518 family protein n=1 Tax=Halosegnis sp. TaxID=2864959 RepID=UPI0035D4C535